MQSQNYLVYHNDNETEWWILEYPRLLRSLTLEIIYEHDADFLIRRSIRFTSELGWADWWSSDSLRNQISVFQGFKFARFDRLVYKSELRLHGPHRKPVLILFNYLNPCSQLEQQQFMPFLLDILSSNRKFSKNWGNIRLVACLISVSPSFSIRQKLNITTAQLEITSFSARSESARFGK